MPSSRLRAERLISGAWPSLQSPVNELVVRSLDRIGQSMRSSAVTLSALLLMLLPYVVYRLSLQLAGNRINYKVVCIAMPSRRAHTKSRLGCVQCKARRVKVASLTLVFCILSSPDSHSAIKLTRRVRIASDTRRLVCMAKSNLALRQQHQRPRVAILQIMEQRQQ
jgi:hypothetical protein